MTHKHVSMPHGLLFIQGELNAIVPSDISKGIAYTKNCVVVSCVHQDEGQLDLHVSSHRQMSYDRCIYNGTIATTGRVLLCNTFNDIIAEHNISTILARIIVYTDELDSPERLEVIIGEEFSPTAL